MVHTIVPFRNQHVKDQEHLRQISLLERDLAGSQERQQELAEKLQAMEVKLSSSENEVEAINKGGTTIVCMLLLIQSKNLQSRLFEQANQINIIQREANHNQQLLAATEEKLKREKVSHAT